MGLDQSVSSRDGYPCSSALLDVDVVHEPGKVVIVLRGDLDRVAVSVLAVCIEEIVGGLVCDQAVVVDLAGVGFVDVGGMNLLLHVTRRAADRGVRLCLAGCSAHLVRLLTLTSIVDELELISA
jgi:anti-anti-sigma factor